MPRFRVSLLSSPLHLKTTPRQRRSTPTAALPPRHRPDHASALPSLPLRLSLPHPARRRLVNTAARPSHRSRPNDAAVAAHRRRPENATAGRPPLRSRSRSGSGRVDVRPRKRRSKPTAANALPSHRRCPGNTAVQALQRCHPESPGHARCRPFSPPVPAHKHPDNAMARCRRRPPSPTMMPAPTRKRRNGKRRTA
jgi:hypothetical protein